MEPVHPLCACCGKQIPVLKRCTRCHRIFYCTCECQIMDWPQHKQICNLEQTNQHMPSDKPNSSELSNNNGDIWPEYKQNNHVDENNEKTPCSPINFEKAFNDIKLASGSEPASQSALNDTANVEKDITPKYDTCSKTSATYVHNNKLCDDIPVIQPGQTKFTLTIKANKQKVKVVLQEMWNGSDILKTIAHATKIPLDFLKLVHKGKFATEANIKDMAKDQAIFQAIGEKAESEEGIHHDDIEIIMRQLSVDRNQAIKALKKTGDLVDAMLLITNK